MSLSPVEIAAYVSAGLLAASRLASLCRPYWNKLPRVVAVALPVVVAALPKLAEQAGLVQTTGDLTMLGITAVAMLLPGVSEDES
jgi:hypothetical protein